MAKRRSSGTAEALTSQLARLSKRIDQFKRERAALASEVHAVVEAGQRMLAEIEGGESPYPKSRRRKGPKAKQAGKRGARKISARARKRMAEAAKRRWARYRAEKKDQS